jgi:hypothetical protein
MATVSSNPATDKPAETNSEMTQPIIVDLGKQKASKLRQLKDGEGELWDEILDVLEEVKDVLGKEADGKLMVPVVMIYEKKQRLRRLEQMLFPLADWDTEADEDEDEEDED